MSVVVLHVDRLATNPIIVADMDDRMGNNVNGPSLIRVPDWVDAPIGRYYLYFAHHKGTYIRLAVADELSGPWVMHRDGVLDVVDSYFDDHIASPDVHIDHARREVRMYFHGLIDDGARRWQATRVAISRNGLDFAVQRQLVAQRPYLRAFYGDGWVNAWSMTGVFWRSPDGLQPFEPMPWPGGRVPSFEAGRVLDAADRWPGPFPFASRHGAVHRVGSELIVAYSMVGDEPEHLVYSIVDMSAPWGSWTVSTPRRLLAPTQRWEGADLQIEPSRYGAAWEPVHQLRDPAFFAEAGGSLHLLYTVAGERGIAIARVNVVEDSLG